MRIASRIGILAIAIAVSGCGITTRNEPPGELNSTLPLGVLKNDVQDPNSGRFTLDAFCGHFVEKTDTGFRPLFIAAYPTGAEPTQFTPAQNAQLDYHSLIDSGGTASVAAAYGAGSGSLSVTGQDRLEVTVVTLSFCRATNADSAAIEKAIDQLHVLNIDRSKVWLVGTATHTQMTIDYLHAISRDEKGAATPIVNFGGQNYSKVAATKLVNFISLVGVPIDTAVATRSGGAVAVLPVPSSPQIGGGSSVASVSPQPPVAIPPPLSQSPAPVQQLSPESFKASVEGAKATLVKVQ